MNTSYCCTLLLLLIYKVSTILPIPVQDVPDGIVVRTVPGGSNVILRCLSNDKAHNFLYWHLVNKGVIIGPANEYNPAKFRFGILSGNLTIKAVSKQEEGLYECVSRAVNGEDLNIRVVRMVVVNEAPALANAVYQDDYNINVIRILIALITLVLLSMGAWFVYVIWKERYRYPHYLSHDEDDDDDDSTEELFSQPSTSKPHSVNNIVPGKSKPIVREPNFENVDISTDFKSILDTSNDE